MGSLGLGGGGDTGGDEAVDLGMHGLGATAGFVLLRVAVGEGWVTTEGWDRRSGLGAMGGGQGLVVAGSLGLGANGGFFTPAREREERYREVKQLYSHFCANESCNTSTKHASSTLPDICTGSCKLWLNLGSAGHSEGQRGGGRGFRLKLGATPLQNLKTIFDFSCLTSHL